MYQWERVGRCGLLWGGKIANSTTPIVTPSVVETNRITEVVFTGTYPRTLDAKARISLPKRLRDELGEGTTLFLTPGTDRCLELHTQRSLNELAQRANQSSAGSRNIKSFSRLFYAQAEPCDIDSAGRIRVPKSLADFAALDKEIVIVGVGFNWEIWNFEQWQTYLQINGDEFDQISQAILDGGAVGIGTANEIGAEQKVDEIQLKAK